MWILQPVLLWAECDSSQCNYSLWDVITQIQTHTQLLPVRMCLCLLPSQVSRDLFLFRVSEPVLQSLAAAEMEQQEVQLDRERFCCSICLDLLKDPVTTGCGHSYCRSCINTHWDNGDQRGSYSCPQCRQTFTPRPVLGTNTMLADLVEELKKTGLQAAPADHCYAGPEDVACDVCTGRKLKALKSCLVCLASYCEKHLQPHLQSAPLKKHKLVEPSEKLQENICSRHDEVMKMFCRTDQQCICYLCSVEEHKDHDTVSAAAERTERQRELGLRRQTIQQRVQDTEKDVKLLQQEEEALNGSADKAVKDSEKIFTELIQLMKKRSSDVKQQIRSQQQTEVRRVRGASGETGAGDHWAEEERPWTEAALRHRGSQPVSTQLPLTVTTQWIYTLIQLQDPSSEELWGRDSSCVTGQRSTTGHSEWDRDRDFTDCVSSGCFTATTTARDWDFTDCVSSGCFTATTRATTRATDQSWLLKIFTGNHTGSKHSKQTAVIIWGKQKSNTYVSEDQSYSNHPDRFTVWPQVLSRESLTGRCYWEVKVKVRGGASVAVTYKDISRAGYSRNCGFGFNDESWSLHCSGNSYYLHYNNIKTPVSGSWSSRVGVYLDHSAGVLSFYRVSNTMTLLHRVQTTFTQPLYAGVRVYYSGDTAEFCKLK